MSVGDGLGVMVTARQQHERDEPCGPFDQGDDRAHPLAEHEISFRPRVEPDPHLVDRLRRQRFEIPMRHNAPPQIEEVLRQPVETAPMSVRRMRGSATLPHRASVKYPGAGRV